MIVPLLGIKDLDDDHRDIILYLLQLKEDKGPIEKTISALNHYLTSHITKEEKLMASVKYPSLSAHLVSHTYMRSITQQLVSDIIRKPPKEVVTLIDTVANIFYNHVIVFDKKFADWLREQEKLVK